LDATEDKISKEISLYGENAYYELITKADHRRAADERHGRVAAASALSAAGGRGTVTPDADPSTRRNYKSG
jgi:hypothetical protein